jgi:hypothetical protein
VHDDQNLRVHLMFLCCAADAKSDVMFTHVQIRAPTGCTVAEIRAAVTPPLSEKGLKCTTIHLDHVAASGGRIPVMMRLQPPTLPWKRDPAVPLTDNDGGVLGSATSIAERALRALSAAKLAVCGERTVLQAGFRQVVISIANLPEELDTEAKIERMLSTFGEIVRVAIITNSAGVSKNFAIVEFAVPSAAAKALAALRKTHEMEVVRRALLTKDTTPAPSASEPNVTPLDLPSIRSEALPTVKLPRAEQCKVSAITDNWPKGMHVSNLPNGYEDSADLSDKVSYPSLLQPPPPL